MTYLPKHIYELFVYNFILWIVTKTYLFSDHFFLGGHCNLGALGTIRIIILWRFQLLWKLVLLYFSYYGFKIFHERPDFLFWPAWLERPDQSCSRCNREPSVILASLLKRIMKLSPLFRMDVKETKMAIIGHAVTCLDKLMSPLGFLGVAYGSTL